MNKLTLSPLTQSDIDEITLAFKNIGWNKPKDIYETYLSEQLSDQRSVFIARQDGKFCGYVTVKWKSDYPQFTQKNIPEIVDLNVLPEFRKQGIGTFLIHTCENTAMERGYSVIGLGVGLTADYGNAQRLYVQLGFLPDGNGIHYKCKAVKYSESVSVDDDLILYFTKRLSPSG